MVVVEVKAIVLPPGVWYVAVDGGEIPRPRARKSVQVMPDRVQPSIVAGHAYAERAMQQRRHMLAVGAIPRKAVDEVVLQVVPLRRRQAECPHPCLGLHRHPNGNMGGAGGKAAALGPTSKT